MVVQVLCTTRAQANLPAKWTSLASTQHGSHAVVAYVLDFVKTVLPIVQFSMQTGVQMGTAIGMRLLHKCHCL